MSAKGPYMTINAKPNIAVSCHNRMRSINRVPCAVSGQQWHLDHASRNMLRFGESLSPQVANDGAATHRYGC